MPRQRSILLHGLRLVVTHPGPLVWSYVFNLGIALLFSLRLHAQLSAILDHSLAAGRLTSAFDLGTLLQVTQRLGDHAVPAGNTNYLGLPVYFLIYFILVPGALFSYQSEMPARLSILLSTGLSYFWRFVRITLLALLVSAAILLPLLNISNLWSARIDETHVGLAALLLKLPGLLIILLIACLLRLYFDMVEVYTIQLGDQFRPNGKADRRVRRALLPAMRTLIRNFWRAYLTFIALTILGFGAFAVTSTIAIHMLAQPLVWPMFLLAQAGLFSLQLTRFWQRGAETVLAADNPLPAPDLSPGMTDLLLAQTIRPVVYNRRASDRKSERTVDPQPDAQPNPEPAAPSLAEPDPGVFHHDPGEPKP